jgi:hypothetical protein
MKLLSEAPAECVKNRKYHLGAPAECVLECDIETVRGCCVRMCVRACVRVFAFTTRQNARIFHNWHHQSKLYVDATHTYVDA